MDRETIGSRLAALRMECAALGREVARTGRGLSADEAFELAGQAQRLANAADGVVAVLGALGARVETTLTGDGPVERVHPVGFVDAMAATEMALATGLTDGVAGRKVALGAALGERFPRLREQVLAGEVPVVAAHKVIDACAGLDRHACAAVDEQVAPRLASCDPARVTTLARQVAHRVAAAQVAAQVARTRRGRTVEVRPGDDGLTSWWALLPTATSAAAWAAVDQLAGQYRGIDDTLTVDQARADAFGDLLLRNVTVTTQVTLGVPVITHTDPATTESMPYGEPTWDRVDLADDDLVPDPDTGDLVTVSSLSAEVREALSWVQVPADDDPCGGAGATLDPRHTVEAVVNGCTVSGTDLPGLGWVDAATVAHLMATVPLDIARAVLDAPSGTLTSVTTGVYRPPRPVRELVKTRDGTCRMWGCTRAATHADLDHTKPWPLGATGPVNLLTLCRRHHRMKQLGRWRPTLHPDATLTWTHTSGTVRTTEPAHRTEPVPPPPEPSARSATPEPIPF
ncbi:hypothetical protein [Oryzobacter telluris]|uniref:HNH endonuclease signature motif containing protein n=1 Tax=Oryzobacter telluris TaxID=3149179 RepID=UPI00370D3BFD